MTSKSKSTFIILIILIIGIIIGALVSGMLRKSRMDKFDRMSYHQRFIRVMDRIIKPSEEERGALEKILRKHSEKMNKVREKHQAEIISIVDSLKIELEKILTDEQLARLEKHLKRGSREFFKYRVDRMTELLDLDENQRNKITELFKNMENDMFRGRKERKEYSRDRRKIMMEHREKLEQAIMDLLTPEQQKKFLELKDEIMSPPGFRIPGPADRSQRDRPHNYK
jgi:hypothetical protein